MQGDVTLPARHFLDDTGEVGALLAVLDWSRTPLGPVDEWPPSLKTAAGIVLRSPVAMVLLWGPDGVMIYNDAYSGFAGGRHPALLGSKVREGWPEVAAFNDNVMRVGLAGGTLSYRDQELVLHRNGAPERVWMNLDYSPVLDEHGRPAGVLAVVNETTDRVLGEARLRDVQTRQGAAMAAAQLGTFEWDLATGAVALDPRSREIFGFADHEGLTTDEVFARIHPDDLPRILAQVRESADRLSRLETEYRILRADGAARVVTSLSDAMPNPHGTAERMVGVFKDVTDRKITEEALRESEARFRFLDDLARATETLTDATAVMKVTARVLGEHLRADVCAYADMEPDQDGFTIRGDWTARGTASIVGFYSLASFGEIAATLLRAGRPLVTRNTLRDLGPEQAKALLSLGLQATVCMPFTKDGRLIALMAVHNAMPRDWTEAELALIAETTERSWAHIERIHAEAALRASEARFEAIANSIDQLIWSTRPDGYHDYYNQRWYDYTGMPAGSTDGDAWSGLFHPDDQDRAWAVWRRCLETGEPYHIEYRLRHRSGQYRWVIGRAQCVRDGEGRIQRWYGTCTDVHDLKVAEAALRDLNANLEQRVADALAERKLWADIFESTDALIAVMAPGYRYLAINTAYAREFEAIFGVRPTVGSSLLDLLADQPEHQEAARAIWDRALAGETFAAVEEFGDPDRKRPFYELRFGALRDRKGTLVAAFQYGQDVTERLRSQAQLLQTEEALRQAQKMEAVGQLTGGVAHDFNNLLTIIKSSTDLLRRPDLVEERRKRYVDAISDTVDRASRLTGQLLAFARRQALKPEVFDVTDRLHAVTDMLRTVLGSRVSIIIDIECDRCFVEADAAQFETALVNMAVNARDAMDGEGTLTIRVDPLSSLPSIRGHAASQAEFVGVSMTDTGTGIAPEKLSHIFEPFFTTKEVGKGTGLGLSQVYGFAKQSGGDVAVESEVGQGTTFTLYLPRASEPAEVDAPAREHVQPAGGRGRRVLVVEDNMEVGRFSTQILEDLGYETTWAANAHEALQRLEEGQAFDVVFSDVVMPGMTGIELGQEIRRRYPQLPVVLTSGYSHVLAEEGRHGFELLQKPYAVEELSRTLRRVSAGTAPSRAAP